MRVAREPGGVRSDQFFIRTNAAGCRPAMFGRPSARAMAHARAPASPSCSRPLTGSWHMQDDSVIDCPQILRIGRDDTQTALPCADRNRDIDDISMA